MCIRDSSLARRGPNAGPQGGVAVFVPAPWRAMRQLELVAGCALAVWATHPGVDEEACFVSLYLSPDFQFE
eukprot:7979791-Lingulodinium_polyedra.AAC.1